MNKNKGFTLIELLVVISVISLLMAILLPFLRKAKEAAREVVCRSNMRGIGIGIQMCLQDNEEQMPDFSGANGFFWYDSAGKLRKPDDFDAYWGVAFKKYIDEPKIFGCPSFRRTAELIYPVDPDLIAQAAYGINVNASGIKFTNIRKPDRFIITHDHVEPKMEQGSLDMFYNDGPGTLNLRHYRPGGERTRFYRGIFRHNIRYSAPFRTGGRSNTLWLDGHVEPIHETTGDDVPSSWYTGSNPT